MTELQRYNFQLIHKPGSSQKKVDTLSHRLDHTQGKNDNKDQILVKGEWFRNIVTQEDKFWKEVEEAEEFIEEEIREAVECEKEGQRRQRKVLFQKGRIYVPDSAILQEEIITKHHDSELAGHPEYTKTYELMTRNYQWPKMLENVK